MRGRHKLGDRDAEGPPLIACDIKKRHALEQTDRSLFFAELYRQRCVRSHRRDASIREINTADLPGAGGVIRFRLDQKTRQRRVTGSGARADQSRNDQRAPRDARGCFFPGVTFIGDDLDHHAVNFSDFGPYALVLRASQAPLPDHSARNGIIGIVLQPDHQIRGFHEQPILFGHFVGHEHAFRDRAGCVCAPQFHTKEYERERRFFPRAAC